ncbi:MAG: 1,4-dihydroxy-2-naphthoate octaprenyltransferase [Nitrososphaerota archaeon]
MPEELKSYNECVVSYLDTDGYPISYPSAFKIEEGAVFVEAGWKIGEGTAVTLTLNHITPIPSGGYTDRKYVMLRGIARHYGPWLRVLPKNTYSWDEKKVPFPEYCEISVPQGRRYADMLKSRYGADAGPKIPLSALLFRSTRFPFLIATVVPVLIATTLAAYDGYFNPLLFILNLVGASLIHLGLNMSNDYFDNKLGADNVNKTPTPFSGGSRIIQYGLLPPPSVAKLSTLFYLGGGIIGVYLAVTRGLIPILAILAVGVLISIFYTAPPVKLAYRGAGEVAVGIGFGPVIVLGSYYVQAQQLTLPSAVASAPIGILVALILYINQIPDIPYDRAAGKITLVTRLTKTGVINLYKSLLAVIYIVITGAILLGLAPPTTALALLTIPYAVKAVRLVESNYGNPYMMIPGMGANIKLATWTGLLHAAGFAVAAVFKYLS